MPPHALSDTLPSLLTNTLGDRVADAAWVAGVLGDHPSQYSRSPALWNAAFAELELDAHYVAFDVPPAHLEKFVSELRSSPGLLGLNVTVPYKQALLPLLDDLDPLARAIGATNCITRTSDGRLIGSNTDAEGALACLIRERPNGLPAFFADLNGSRVLLIGAGGAGRAVAASLVPRLGQTGRLILANRTEETARTVARAVDPGGQRVIPLSESRLGDVADDIDLVINASTRGQAGFFPAQSGRVTCLEPYSPLGPASPASIDPDGFTDDRERWRAWFFKTLDDLRQNEAAALAVLERLNPRARFFDLVYAPAETTLLRTARWAGHPTLNGADMILHQAVAGFLLIAGPLLDDVPEALRPRVEAAMRSA